MTNQDTVMEAARIASRQRKRDQARGEAQAQAEAFLVDMIRDVWEDTPRTSDSREGLRAMVEALRLVREARKKWARAFISATLKIPQAYLFYLGTSFSPKKS